MKTPGSTHHYNHGGHRGSGLDARVSITSEEILDEHAQSHRYNSNRGGANRKVLIIGVLVFVAVAGAVVAYVVTSSGSSSSASNASGASGSNNSTGSGSGSGVVSTPKPTRPSNSTGAGSSNKEGNGKVLPNPNTMSFPVTVFAIGDWGTTEAPKDSCCQRRDDGIYNAFDYHGELLVTKLMDKEAGNKKPEAVISHGDNFYWTGIDGDDDRDSRFELSFEQRHKTPAMMDVPWVNVMGNHDYGGGSFICMTNKGRRECNDPADLVASLEKRFQLQSSYKSPVDNRWIMKEHFYVHTVEKGGVSIDIFNLDMNDADSHGAHETCCQCYAYAKGDNDKCKNVSPGNQYCAGGNVAMYTACVGQFKKWGEEARTQLKAEVKSSKATWKIVNSHYNPYGHYGETGGKEWLQLLKEIEDVHVWLGAHTHGEKHDYIEDIGVHFIENGAGGGVQSEAPSGEPGWMTTPVERVWTAGGLGGDGGNTYGFFALDASTEWLKARYITFGDGWNPAKDVPFNDGMAGGAVATGHCWYIPIDGSKGQKC